MSHPASPTRLNRNATLAEEVASRTSDAMAMMAPAPAQMPSTAATMGCGQARMALTRSPVISVKRNRSVVFMATSGPMISRTSPPDEKLPPAPESTKAFTDSSDLAARKRPTSSA